MIKARRYNSMLFGSSLIKLALCFLLSALVNSLTCLALDNNAATALQKKMSAIHSLRANFIQTIRSKQRLLSQTVGTIIVARPGRFRWEAREPLTQIVVADGQKIWIYDVDLEQVTVRKQTQSMGAAGALLLSQSADAIARHFTVRVLQKGQNTLYFLQAKSSTADVAHAQIIFDGNLLAGIDLDDQVGQHTSLRFTKVIVNQQEPERLFHFTIPAGVDVVSQ